MAVEFVSSAITSGYKCAVADAARTHSHEQPVTICTHAICAPCLLPLHICLHVKPVPSRYKCCQVSWLGDTITNAHDTILSCSVNGNLTASDINRNNVLARNPHVKMFDPSPIHKVR